MIRVLRGFCGLAVCAGLMSCAATGTTADAGTAIGPNDVQTIDEETQSLTGKPGDPAAGAEIFASRKQGNCLACHANSDLSDQLFHGDVGPSLDGVASRWSTEQLRTIVVNSKTLFSSATVMPGFYTHDVGEDVREDLIGKTILTAEQVEDVVAYLASLK